MTSWTPFRSRTFSSCAALIALGLTTFAPAAVKLASPFGDHMVLQQGRPVPVWGWANAGETVTITFAGQKKSVTADAAGTWRVTLDPLVANAEPRDFVVSSANPKSEIGNRKFSDVLVGEVWLCGGQSNMERHLGLQPGQKPIVGWEETVSTANFPLLRQFYVPHRAADTPQTTTDGNWSVCSPATALDFSAVGFYFAREILRTQGVPIGILHSSYGGTPAEAWTSEAGLKAFPEFADAVARARSALTNPERARDEFLAKLNIWYRQHDPGSGKNPWSAAGTKTKDWETMNLPALWEDAGHPDWDGVAWFNKTFDLPSGWKGRDLDLYLSAVDDIDTTWVNGVEVGSTTFYNTQRKYRVPAAKLKSKGNQIMLRTLDTGGGGGIWEPRLRLEIVPADGKSASVSLAGPWKIKFAVSLDGIPRPPENTTATGVGVPSVLYNAMIAPLVPYAMRGATFYQGEANAARAIQYRTLLPAMIADWRRLWGDGDFPFLFVQVAPFDGLGPEIRESQLLAWQETTNTAMVVTIDVGDAKDIHPANKQPVGERLALAARALAYGESIEYSGPVYRSLTIDGSRAILSFAHCDRGLVAKNGALTGFTAAGADGKFVSAQAEIVGETVVVTSPEVAQPAAVRYGWAAVASGNLFNAAGLPASPFRTDVPAK